MVLLLGAVTFAVTQFLRPDAQQSRAAPQWQPYVDYAKQFTLWMTSVSPHSADSAVQRVIDGSTGSFRDDFANKSRDFIKTIMASNATSEGADYRDDGSHPRSRDGENHQRRRRSTRSENFSAGTGSRESG